MTHLTAMTKSPSRAKATDDPILRLSRNYTQLQPSEKTRKSAIDAAFWVTASPHEWVWTPEQQEHMARYVLWAHQRLSALLQIANEEPLTHEPEEN